MDYFFVFHVSVVKRLQWNSLGYYLETDKQQTHAAAFLSLELANVILDLDFLCNVFLELGFRSGYSATKPWSINHILVFQLD